MPLSSASHQLMQLEKTFGANTYSPLPLVLTRAKGIHAWDDQGKQYIDMMSAYSAVSHGHCHPRLVEVMRKHS